MDLPSHDTNKHLLVQAQHHNHTKRNPKEHTALRAIPWRGLSIARRNHNVDRLAEPSFRQAPDKNKTIVWQ